jgi:putative Ca2+/H+ antiporter (TMEM165/GDT1 family)
VKSLFEIFLATFASVFVAELGDKTQLATMALAAGNDGTRARLVVFCGAALALVATSALGVLAGAAMGKIISPLALKRIGGVLFVAIGAWMLLGRA